MNRLTLRKVHRWLGLIAGIQLLAWTVSGLYFTLIPIEEIHGDHLLTNAPGGPAVSEFQLLSPDRLVNMHTNLEGTTPGAIRLSSVLDRPVYLIGNDRFNAVTGNLLPEISRDEAIAIAERRTSHAIITTVRIDEVPDDSEYRGGELPAWKITIDRDDAALYVGTTTGRIRAVRTEAWRWFDYLWSLHIMDYEEREDFNHLLIQVLATMGLITVISGLALFFMTQRWRPPRT